MRIPCIVATFISCTSDPEALQSFSLEKAGFQSNFHSPILNMYAEFKDLSARLQKRGLCKSILHKQMLLPRTILDGKLTATV